MAVHVAKGLCGWMDGWKIFFTQGVIVLAYFTYYCYYLLTPFLVPQPIYAASKRLRIRLGREVYGGGVIR